MPAPRRPARKASPAKSEPQPEFPIVYVKYHDHCWLEAKELEKIHVAKPYVVEETGFLLTETEKYITLAKERSTDGEKNKTQYDDVTIIMRSDILELELFERRPGPGAGHRAPGAGRRARGEGRGAPRRGVPG